MLRELQERRRRQLGLERLRPWDTAVDPLQRPALQPFTDVAELIARPQKFLTGWTRNWPPVSPNCIR